MRSTVKDKPIELKRKPTALRAYRIVESMTGHEGKYGANTQESTLTLHTSLLKQ
tara:strand:- start:3377 stop:3538 length:162 start_codon:yes stop_codon:yes gene_type:complete